MRDSVLWEQKDKYMLPVAEQLFGAIHPNVVSFVALGVGLLCAAATLNGEFGLGLLLWVLNRVLDEMGWLHTFITNRVILEAISISFGFYCLSCHTDCTDLCLTNI